MTADEVPRRGLTPSEIAPTQAKYVRNLGTLFIHSVLRSASVSIRCTVIIVRRNGRTEGPLLFACLTYILPQRRCIALQKLACKGSAALEGNIEHSCS